MSATIDDGPFCTCGVAKEGFTVNSPGDPSIWLHAECLRPRRAALPKQVLIMFRGGDLDGKVYEYSTLVDPHYSINYQAYRWTREIVTSDLTGARAHVWVHRDVPIDPSMLKPADRAAESRAEGSSTRVRRNPKEEETVDYQVDGDDFLRRRKAMKLGRRVFGEALGVSEPDVWRIEVGRALPAETVVTLVNGLRQMEIERGIVREHSAPPSSADDSPGDTEGQTPRPRMHKGRRLTGVTAFVGDVRLKEWGDFAEGDRVRWDRDPSARYTFRAHCTDPRGHEYLEIWGGKRGHEKLRFARTYAVSKVKLRGRRAS